MSALRLYPAVKVIGQDFTKVKICTVPSQSLTLKDIIKRFIRKEPLAIGRDGIYNDKLGDLEKMSREDITVQTERAQSLKASLKVAKKTISDRQKALESPPPAPAPSGAVTGSAGSGQAPAPSSQPSGVTA